MDAVEAYKEKKDYRLPKRIRLLLACRDHLYNEVKLTLASDKEIKALRGLHARISHSFVLLNKPNTTSRIENNTNKNITS